MGKNTNNKRISVETHGTQILTQGDLEREGVKDQQMKVERHQAALFFSRCIATGVTQATERRKHEKHAPSTLTERERVYFSAQRTREEPIWYVKRIVVDQGAHAM